MYIKKIIIKNFRSIKHQEFECEKFNVFIGKNNHGKSNVFEAFDWFFNNKGEIEEIKTKGSNEFSEVEVVFGDANKGLETMNDDNRHKKTIELKMQQNEIVVTRKIRQNNKGKYEAKLFLIDDRTPVDGALVDYLPKFRYINAREHIDKHDGYKKANILGELLVDVVENATKHDKFTEFKKNFKDFIDNTFKVEVQANIESKIKDYLNEQFDGTIEKF